MKTPLPVLALLLAALPAGAATPAPAADSARHDADVYVSGKDGYNTYRIPAIEVAPDGSLLAFAEARKYTSSDPGMGRQEIDLVLKRSTDAGATWSAMTVVEHSGEYWSSANPATLVDRTNGKVWVFYVRGRPGCSTETSRPGTDDMRNLARWSTDNGKSWSEPLDMTPVARDLSSPTWRSSLPGPGGALQNRQGRLIVALWKMPFSCLDVFSDDHGKTWHRGGIVPGPQGGDECKIVELHNGRLLFDMRQETGPTRWLVESSDGGVSWSGLRPGIKVTDVACAIKRYTEKASGKGHGWLIWTGPEGDKRERLVMRGSADDGKTFPTVKRISDKFAAYSDLGLLHDGSVGVLWERGVKKNYEFITFTRLSRQWLDPVLAKHSSR